jgi:hypothetical protein
MKKTLLSLAICTGLFFGGWGINSQVQFDTFLLRVIKEDILKELDTKRIFKYDDYKSFDKKEYIVNKEKDIENLIVDYDFGGNGKIDVKAYFKIVKDSIKQNAIEVDVDKKGYGFFEIKYFDKDEDGILEDKIVN